MINLVPVGTMNIMCPECFAIIPIEVTAKIEGAHVDITPDMTDVWAHAFMHDARPQ